ncbi:Thiol peroxidase, Tpx-type [hydrothermal vent metagenome]|uniref:Thiol peroxidase, Tpx-type n=1 Tax=hydrothermal vent metagenome TaxID=652676 RepID=A0A3B1BDK1_9ZZZZ
MTQITLKDNPINTIGTLPSVGSQAPDFQLTKTDLSDLSLADLQGQQVILNIFPSVDTDVCAASVRFFNAKANALENTTVLCISDDLPFAQKRFCGAEGLENVVSASEMRNRDFGDKYGVRIIDGPLAGLLARAIVILDKTGKVIYTEQVPEITQEPDYDAALAAIS